MLIKIARFEFRYLLRNPILWVTAALTFAMFFAAMCADGFELGSEGGLNVNAAYATLRNYVMISLLYMFVTTSFVANAVMRDDETGFGPIVRTTRITKFDYLFGRFLGAFAVAALCMLMVPLGILLGTLMPWANTEFLGPNRLADHLYGYFLLALPNIFIHSAIFFALATITRSMMATYLGVLAFVSGFFTLEGTFADRPQLETVVALAEPFGARALSDASRYWTVPERNTLLPDFAGAMLYNRLIWIGVAVLFLGLAYAAYRFADRGMSKRERKRQKFAEPVGQLAPVMSTALPKPRHTRASTRALLWMRTRFEVKQVFLSPVFIVLMVWLLFTTLISLTTQRDPDGRPSYPTTLSMIPDVADGLGAIPFIIAIFYAGELVWRERDRRMHEIVDASPMPNWAYVVPKTMAMAFVLMAMLLATVAASIGVQLNLGFTHLELGKYLLWYVLPMTMDMLLLATLAIFVQALSPHKAVGWGIMVLFVVWQYVNTAIDHNLLNYGGKPSVPLSDLNGAGSFWKGAWTFRTYWGAFAILLLLVAHLLWRRGTEIRLRPRLALARRRLMGTGWVAAAALLVFVGTGAYAFYNTNVLNEYHLQQTDNEALVEFERRFGKYIDLPQPEVAEIKLDVALYPEDRRAVTKGQYVLRNATAKSIAEIHTLVVDDDLEVHSATVSGARLILDDTTYNYRIYRLDRPMLPGEQRVLTCETRLWARGFRNKSPNTRIVENGTFLGEVQLMPVIGVSRTNLIQDPRTRRKYGLPESRPIPPKLESIDATMIPSYDRGWAKADVTVSTSADQTPLAPGNKVSDITRDGRRVARFVSNAPIHPRFAVLSARYAEKHRMHNGVDLAVFYHPAHAWNVDRMLDAMASSIDYYKANFGPYQFDHARIVEFPGYHNFAQAFAGTIPYSETVGFISDYRKPDTTDYVTGMTAHELAHQYWAHQVIGAETEGKEVLSETLAQYSAQMVMRKTRGADQIRRYLQFELDRYLEGRAYTSREETPLARVAGQNHITYRKGALVMYLLQERLGEEAVNRALRSLVTRYKFKGPPYPRTLELIEALRGEAKTEEDRALITDLFERITLYDLKVIEPTAVRRADGKWDVTVPVEAKKLYADGKGTEIETPLVDRIEVGLFTAEPGRDAFDKSKVLLMERHPIRSGRQVLRFVSNT
ncbi:MAG TPA: M1 family aminopeptidase, partial [Thermoanaerobaculia bacterium]